MIYSKMSKRKYCLVQFVDDAILYVVQSKSVTLIEGDLVWAPYKKLGFYEAKPLEYSDDRTVLEMRRNSMINKEQMCLFAEPMKQLIEENFTNNLSLSSDGLDVICNSNENDSERDFSAEHDKHDDSDKDFTIYKLSGCFNGSITISSNVGDSEQDAATPKDLLNDSYEDFNIYNLSCSSGTGLDSASNLEDFGQERNNKAEPKSDLNHSYENVGTNNLSGCAVEDFDRNNNLKDSGNDKDNCSYAARPAKFKTPDMCFKSLNILGTKHSKQHFCKFCFKLQTKFARHLENKHKDEEEVDELSRYPKKNAFRLKLIEKIRVAGDFLYNTQKEYNTDGHLIVVRRPVASKSRNAEHFRPCGNCGGMYSHLSLVAHYRKCKKNRVKGTKDVLFSSRQKSMYVSAEANHVLRNKVFPSLREDQISKIIMSDELIILFGNRLCQKYRSPHLFKMIRAKMRCVARFFSTFKGICGLPDIKFEHIFDPSNYEFCILAINKMCGLNRDTGKYTSPATAFSIGSHLKRISFYLVSEYIKNKNKPRQEEVRDFLILLKEGLTHDVYKTVLENQLEWKRKKKITLPSSKDIQCLRIYLEKQQIIFINKLKARFQYKFWKELLSLTLTSLQLFNRRRAGEMERVEISDFLNYEQLHDNDEMLIHLDSHEKKKMKHYVRFLIRGKLSRGVPVMVNKLNLSALKILIAFRNEAKVPLNNKYLFGIPGSSESHLSASKLMNKYSSLCGAQRPSTLRGTELRKHIATKCGAMNLGKTGIKDIAEYLGHHEKIHLEHYRLPNAVKDIVRMSEILEKAQGNDQMDDSYSIAHEDNESEDGSIITPRNKQIEYGKRKYGVCISNDKSSYFIGEKTKQHRISWSDDEKFKVDEEFEFYIHNFEMPTLAECKMFLEQDSLNRSIGQLRGYISNRIREKKKEMLRQSPPPIKSKKVNRTRWTTEEKKDVFKIFNTDLVRKTLPSIKYCQEVAQTTEALKGRTGEMLRAFINNINKKKLKISTE